MTRPTKRSRKKKEKEWYKILVPEMFGNAEIGETLAYSPDSLIGRKLEVPMSELTNEVKNVKMILRICDVDGNTARTELIGHAMDREYLRSLTRRKSSKIDNYTNVTTKDGYSIRVKTSCFTLKKADRSQERSIREKIEEVVKSKAGEMDFNRYMQEVILGNLSADIYKTSKKIYPLRRVEVYKTEVISTPK